MLSLVGLLIGSSIVFLVGVIDDIYGVNVAFKFTGQIIASLVAIFFGVQIFFIATPFNTLLYLGVWAVPFTLVWMVGITNALNLIDGLDGLASGVAAIAALTLFFVAIRTGQLPAAILSLIIAGISVGFLRYNFHPASIFLGDSGSLFLGFLLASLSVVGVLKSTIVIAFIVPIFVLGIPIYDTATVIIRRMREKKGIFKADKRHFHHRLLKAGFSQREAVAVIYIACALLGSAALIATAFNNYQIIIFLSIIVVGAILGMDLAKDILRRSTQGSSRREK
ncbi:MraY family glycosyltransferase [Candidatus Margulisiibacteriota bacterium]